jgi:hypothetical protein
VREHPEKKDCIREGALLGRELDYQVPEHLPRRDEAVGSVDAIRNSPDPTSGDTPVHIGMAKGLTAHWSALG